MVSLDRRDAYKDDATPRAEEADLLMTGRAPRHDKHVRVGVLGVVAVQVVVGVGGGGGVVGVLSVVDRARGVCGLRLPLRLVLVLVIVVLLGPLRWGW